MAAKRKKSKKQHIEELLSCAQAQKAGHIRDFLKDVGQHRSGTKADLGERLAEFLRSETDGMRSLTEWLNHVEGWGNQHVYLYKSAPAQCLPWRKKTHVLSVLRQNKVARLFNASRAVGLPDEPTLSAVEWDSARLRFIWNETRVHYIRRDDLDYVEADSDAGEVEYRARQRKISRGTIAFDWDLTTGEAMLMIQRLPSGTQYDKERDEIINWLYPFVDLTTFTPVRVSRAVKKILETEEVKNRKTNWETLHGGRADLASARRGRGVRDDSTLMQMEDIGKKTMQPRLGNLYWLPNGSDLESEFHTVIVRKDQRVAIHGQKTEDEVRYVIGRIRFYCK